MVPANAPTEPPTAKHMTNVVLASSVIFMISFVIAIPQTPPKRVAEAILNPGFLSRSLLAESKKHHLSGLSITNAIIGNMT